MPSHVASPPRPVVLILSQSDQIGTQLGSLLSPQADVVIFGYHDDAVAAVTHRRYDAAIIPLDLPGVDGEWVARLMTQRDPQLCCIRQAHSFGVDAESLLSSVERAIAVTQQRRGLTPVKA